MCCNWPRKAWIGRCAKMVAWLKASISIVAKLPIPTWRKLLASSAWQFSSGDEPMANPLVVLLMGSDSDLPTVKEACAVLQDFGVSFEAHVLSAHRTPADLTAFVRRAEQSGARV